MPDCGVHYLWFAFVCFLIRSPPPPPQWWRPVFTVWKRLNVCLPALAGRWTPHGAECKWPGPKKPQFISGLGTIAALPSECGSTAFKTEDGRILLSHEGWSWRLTATRFPLTPTRENSTGGFLLVYELWQSKTPSPPNQPSPPGITRTAGLVLRWCVNPFPDNVVT